MIPSTATRGNTCRPPARSSATTLPERIEQTLDYESAPPPAAAAQDPHQIWCVDIEGRIETKTTFELWVDVSTGTTDANARVWREGMECWLPLGEVAELRCALPLNEELDFLLDAMPESSEVRALPSVEPASGIRHGRAVRAEMPTRPMGEVVAEREPRRLPAGSAAALSAAVAFGVALVIVAGAAEGAPPSRPTAASPTVAPDLAPSVELSSAKPRSEPGQRRRR